MADLVVTAASVVPGSGAQINRGNNAGATITAGQTVYQDTNGLWQLAKANGTTAQKALAGIALANASANQPLAVQTSGPITIGATVTAGNRYWLSGNNAGGICPDADVGAGYRVILVGIATSTTVILMNVFDSTAQL